jgi:hypothetical protein
MNRSTSGRRVSADVVERIREQLATGAGILRRGGAGLSLNFSCRAGGGSIASHPSRSIVLLVKESRETGEAMMPIRRGSGRPEEPRALGRRSPR